MIPIMTHESESTESISPAESGQGDSRPGRANRLDLLLTVVGIVAGVVFVVSLIFFSGFFLGRATHSPYGGQPLSDQQPQTSCPMMDHGKMGSGGMKPEESVGPQQTPPTPAQTPVPRP
ncbi:hypothetical protein [Mycobacterium intracellulare]|uniref:Uncharacterized protein n=2 Tax=Mycobacterium intracellulare TaxID=1767 RepID=A0A7U5MJ11_MYCIT|nr:hypothetical protein [Mycobacterium intracellulare]ASL14463.1 hypothetical protein MYCOZU2_02045 [Mycobacterium intracellulare subsp. chimaera]MDM3930433.1 hypothetical protein [Mycobacterium intracellulare subsp. chimaera]